MHRGQKSLLENIITYPQLKELNQTQCGRSEFSFKHKGEKQYIDGE